MKIYVVSAQYCEDTVIVGATLDERTAERIVECEEQKKPDWVGYEEFNTDDYIPLSCGMNPYNVMFYKDGSVPDAKLASLKNFEQNSVFDGAYHGKRCLIYDVYALGKEHALRLATVLKEKYENQQKEL